MKIACIDLSDLRLITAIRFIREADNTPDMVESEQNTDRTVVQTYVPAYQRQAWDDHADRLEMSRSEFVRTMVQAGRRGFGADPEPDETGTDNDDIDLDTQVRRALEEEPLSWEELLAAVTGDIETRLDDSLKRLQAADELRYSGRRGGYVLEGDRS